MPWREKFGIIAKCLTPPPPPPPDCKVLGRLAAASALTLAAVVAAANPAQAQQGSDPLPNTPCVAATHFEAPGLDGKCLPKTGDLPNTEEVCTALGGTLVGDRRCNDFAVVTGTETPDASCQWFDVTFTSNRSCGKSGQHLAVVRDCNLANKVAETPFRFSSDLACSASACGSGEKAVGGRCRSALNCQGDLRPNSAGDACVCPTETPYFKAGDATQCVAQCAAGEGLVQATSQCEACGVGEYNAAGDGACDSCFPPASEGVPGSGISSVAGLQVSGGGSICENIFECAGRDANEEAAKALELCGPNAACNDLDPRDNPSGFTVGEWRYSCDCAEGFSDPNDGGQAKLNCSGTGDRTVAILDSDNGTVLSTPPAGDLDFETEVVFTATPDLGFMVSAWVGADEWVRSGNCDAGATRCEVTVTRALEVGAVFEDVDECAAGTDGCPADSSCRNLDAAEGGGRFACDCDDASLDFAGGVCTGAREVAILASSGGAVSAVVSGDGTVIETRGDVAHGATVVLRAAPVAGARVSVWLGVSGVGDCAARAAECVVTVTRDVEVGAVFEDVDECASAADDCPSASSCRNLDAVSGEGRFACDCAESLYEFDEAARSCGCATMGHLLFGDEGNQRCASPVICPAGYDDSNFDCVEDEAAPLTPEQVASRELCLAFGGVREAVVDLSHPGVCSNVDINDTFCFLEAGEALSCRGLFEHVRDCNALNRPALDPWHCAAACGDKQARGRRCETVTR